MRYLANVTNAVFDLQIPNEDSYTLSVFAAACIFNDFCSAGRFGTYSTIGGYGGGIQDYFIDKTCDAIRRYLPEYIEYLKAQHPGITALRAYIEEHAPLNVLSPFHLLAQSMCVEHVYLLFIFALKYVRTDSLCRLLKLFSASVQVTWNMTIFQQIARGNTCVASATRGRLGEQFGDIGWGVDR